MKLCPFFLCPFWTFIVVYSGVCIHRGSWAASSCFILSTCVSDRLSFTFWQLIWVILWPSALTHFKLRDQQWAFYFSLHQRQQQLRDPLVLLLVLEPCPSLLLQRHMAELLSTDKDMAASFLNSVLNQLNWAFSEFIGMIQEVRLHCHERTG